MISSLNRLATFKCAHQWVIVRADLNIPRDTNGGLLNTFKAEKLIPTLKYIQKKEGKIVLIAHCGRPEKPDTQNSLQHFIPWFEKHGFKPVFANSIEQALALQKKSSVTFIILENLRFFPQETTPDKLFAEQLKKLGTFFVQDAAGNLHRNHTSMTLLPKLFITTKKSIGLLVAEELEILQDLKSQPKKPFMALLGGSKIATKLPLITGLSQHLDVLMLLPALVFTVLKAEGQSVGKSLVEDDQIDTAQTLVATFKQNQKLTLLTPLDYLVTTHNFEKPFPLKVVQHTAPDQTGISFGPETVKFLKKICSTMRTIFINGAPGNPAYTETIEPFRILLTYLQNTNAQVVIAGGDTVALTQQLGFTNTEFTLLTSGGAALSFLSNQELVGLSSLR